MKRKIASTALVFVLCIGFVAGCNPFPLREDTVQTPSGGPLKTEEEQAEPEEDATVIAPVEIPEGETDILYCVSPVNVRSLPGMQGAVIGELISGQRVSVTGKEGGWYEIVYEGDRGYVYEEYLSKYMEG